MNIYKVLGPLESTREKMGLKEFFSKEKYDKDLQNRRPSNSNQNSQGGQNAQNNQNPQQKS